MSLTKQGGRGKDPQGKLCEAGKRSTLRSGWTKTNVRKKRVGFVGLGDLGLGMAKSLIKSGFPLVACDLRREPVEELRLMGAGEAKGPKELAHVSEIVISVVRDIPQTDSVMFGTDGLLENFSPGSTLIISSTLGPNYVQRLAIEAGQRHINVLDATVTGPNVGTEGGALTFMVGGNKEVFESCLSLFQAMGQKVFHLGGVGAGQVSKLVNNIVLNINCHAVSEGIAYGLKAGLKLDQMLEVLKFGTGNSWVVEHYSHMARRRKTGQRKGFETTSTYKDLDLALNHARELRTFVLPVAALISQLDKGTLFPEKVA